MMNTARMVFQLESYKLKCKSASLMELTQMLELLTECKIIVRDELDLRNNGDKI